MRMNLLVIMLVGLLNATPGLSEPGRLTVVGQGSYNSVPDMATITMGVMAQARTAAQALESNSAGTAAMLAVITAAGVEAKDIQTSGLSLSPVWNNQSSGNTTRPDIVGYQVRNQVTVRVRDLTKLGGILDAAVKSGTNNFNGLSFGLQDPVPAADSARVAAIQDAVRKAELYAKTAGTSLGPIIEITEAGMAAPGPVMMREMSMADSVPIAEGQVSTSARVTIIYQLGE